MISLIAAMAHNRVIGINNGLPWHLPSDMKWFRQHTIGKPILMGRKTFESFGGSSLPQRTNIVVTRDAGYRAEGSTVVTSIQQAICAAGSVDEIMIIGGASFYKQMLPRAHRLYLTYVDAEIKGDAEFPEFNWDDWRVSQRHDVPADERNPYSHQFVILERRIFPPPGSLEVD